LALAGEIKITKSVLFDVNAINYNFVNDYPFTLRFLKFLIAKSADKNYRFNSFQSNFSATHILPSSNLFWAGKRLVDYL
jgi:hypothetical protein